MTYEHVPVLQARCVELLARGPRGWIVDATVGLGGHAQAILERIPGSRLVGLDVDPEALDSARRRLRVYGDRVRLVRSNYSRLDACLTQLDIDAVAGILFDLGLSSLQIDAARRGFSYRSEGPLDMRMDPSSPRTAADWINAAPEEEIADVLRRYGEEHAARRIARAIVRRRTRAPLRTTTELVTVVESCSTGRRPVSTLARVFQGVRMWVNGELENIRQALERSLGVLAPGSVLAVLSYHSLEDRLVKQFFRRQAEGCVCPPDLPRCGCGFVAGFRLLTRRAVRPDAAEVEANVRARSARLRALQRVE